MRSLNTCVVLEFRVDSSVLSMDGLQYFQTLTMNSIGPKKNPGMSTKKLVFFRVHFKRYAKLFFLLLWTRKTGRSNSTFHPNSWFGLQKHTYNGCSPITIIYTFRSVPVIIRQFKKNISVGCLERVEIFTFPWESFPNYNKDKTNRL